MTVTDSQAERSARIEHFADTIRVEFGRVAPGLVSVFAVIRDEMFFLPAFLAHHRSIGVRQFLFLDDSSTDGSLQYLRAQPDCVILRSPLAYADQVTTLDLGGEMVTRRACFFFKQYVPDGYLHGQFVIVLDADEFLLLPPGVGSVDQLVASLARHGVVSAGASLLEFYPRRLSELHAECAPMDLEQLLRHAPYYDHAQLAGFRWWDGLLKGLRPSVSTRVMEAAGISDPYTTTPFKVPVYRHDGNWIVGSHGTRRTPDRRVLLTIAHFKFTYDLYRRTTMAIALNSHSQGSRKYHRYAELFAAARERDVDFVDPATQSFSGTDALIECGLMRWRLPLDQPER